MARRLSLILPVTFSAGYPGLKTIFAQAYPDTSSAYFTVGSLNCRIAAVDFRDLTHFRTGGDRSHHKRKQLRFEPVAEQRDLPRDGGHRD